MMNVYCIIWCAEKCKFKNKSKILKPPIDIIIAYVIGMKWNLWIYLTTGGCSLYWRLEDSILYTADVGIAILDKFSKSATSGKTTVNETNFTIGPML